MNYKTSIALAAMAAMLAVPGVAEAAAKKKPVHHAVKKAPVKHGGPSTTEQLHVAQDEIAQMKAQLNALQAKLDQKTVAAPAPEVVAQVAQAQAVAQQAQTQAAAAETKADQAVVVAQQTQVAEKKTEKDLGSVLGVANTKISGRMYVNFSNIQQDQFVNGAGKRTPATGTGFNIKRIYVGIDHKFSDVFSFNVTTDISNVYGATSNYSYSNDAAEVGRGFYVKKAYIEAKLSPAFIIRAGSADLPWVPYDENIYGYRHIEQTMIDGPYGTSADWGIHVLGNLGKHFDYQVSMIDGAGYRAVKVTKSVDFEGRIGFNYAGVFAAVGGYVGKNGNAVEGTATPQTARRFDAMGGFKNELFTLGAEYFYAKNWKLETAADNKQDSASGLDIFGNVNFGAKKKWSVFGEYQWVEPSRLQDPTIRNHYFNVGLQWEPVKIVDIALVYKRDAIDGIATGTSMTYGTNNGYLTNTSPISAGVGCVSMVAGQSCRGTYDEVGLFGMIRW